MNGFQRYARGFSLLELVVGLLIFSTGMLALAALQGQLTRSQADAAVRSMATNIAEEHIESLRGFGLVESEAGSTIPAYQDIVAETFTVTRGNLEFTATTQVTDYYYDLTTDSFTTTNTESFKVSDFKEVAVNVSWGNTPGFRISESQDISAADIGSGEIELRVIVSSVTTQGSARSSTQEERETILPPVSYTPGQNPDIVSLRLGELRFKESTTPLPQVFRGVNQVETRFDVITYSQTNDGALFLRREEFIGVTCQCQLQAPPIAAEQGGRLPTTWAGDEYDLGTYVIKPTGTPANVEQSMYCDACCRDHHDGATVTGDTAAARYNPFRAASDYVSSGTFQGDHRHYALSVRGALSEAVSAGQTYVEACRMVRVDGFMRVGQDFRQEGLNVFPEDFLDEPAEVDAYSNWVTTSAELFENALSGDYEAAPLTFPAPPLAPAEGGFPTETYLPTPLTATQQQLRSRGVYMDYMRDDLRAAIDCLRALPDGGDATDCNSDTIKFDKSATTNVLELIPFFDVQLTWLNRWTESPIDLPVDTTNETVMTGNVHSRGMASLTTGGGNSTITASGHGGNIGLTDTDGIDPNFSAEINSSTLTVVAGGEDPNSGDYYIIRGLLTSGVIGVRAADLEVVGDGAHCDRLTDGYICQVNLTATAPVLVVSGYKKQGVNLAACSNTMAKTSSGTDSNGRGFSRFDLAPSPALDTSVSHDISIQQDSCG